MADGRLGVLLAIAGLAGVAAVRSRAGGSHGIVRSARSVPDCDEKRAIEVITKVTISPMNDRQLRRWKKDGVLVCPHGKKQMRVTDLLPVWWNATKIQDDRGTLFAHGERLDSGGSSRTWIECDCTPESAAFWPPDDLKIEYL